ncbi:hypothetical protein [Chryseobacterium aquaticum]|uniref:Phage head morphogenesis domain-containing protein n=1 Tax=Chryseobacterium aquaticum subsp. greenlandense TaxID=345663 RepID=A0A101CHQ7_9FLAO|nr:hypothetical protein [Chryseobacterium aquaticum]KUJ56434.1 hypothetical protein AR686_07685 [Chryseobacterium aquaticum subsp. greenlandense]
MAKLHDDNFDNIHFERGGYNVRRIKNYYQKLIEDVVRLISLNQIDVTKLFYFKDYPTLKKSVDVIFEQFANNISVELNNQIEQSWKYGEKKQADLVNRVASRLNLSKEKTKEYLNPNTEALKAFKTRKSDGLKLSDRVWKLSNQLKKEIELGLDLGIGEGKSAAKLARELKSNLTDPDRLFRRIRDKHGNLVLSKNAKAYNPGQGVYRYSYKNAERLTRTENNIAYHEANYQKMQRFDFVRGIEIRLSNNPNHCPFCEAMAGIYPKDFKFWGWHPQCLCSVITLLKTWEEMERDNTRILQGLKPLESANMVKELPPQFTSWVSENKDKIQNAKSKPYFIQNNKEKISHLL